MEFLSKLYAAEMAQFDRAIATVLRLIEKNGQSVVWNSLTNAAPADTSKPWKPGAAGATPHTVSICFIPVRDKETRKLIQYLKGTDVPIGQLAGLMGQVSFEPAVKDVVVRDSKQLAISSIDWLSPNGQKILCTIEFEG